MRRSKYLNVRWSGYEIIFKGKTHLFSWNPQKTQALGETTLHFANTSKKTNHGQISLTWPDHYSSKRSKYSQFEKTFTYFCNISGNLLNQSSKVAFWKNCPFPLRTFPSLELFFAQKRSINMTAIWQPSLSK